MSVYVAISSGLSATCDTARMIAESITDFLFMLLIPKTLALLLALLLLKLNVLLRWSFLREIGAKPDQASLTRAPLRSQPYTIKVLT